MTRLELTQEEREVMCHALGIRYRTPTSRKVYRNKYESVSDDPTWCGLVDRGLAVRNHLSAPDEAYTLFHVTDAGCIALIGMTLVRADGRKLTVSEVREAFGFIDRRNA